MPPKRQLSAAEALAKDQERKAKRNAQLKDKRRHAHHNAVAEAQKYMAGANEPVPQHRAHMTPAQVFANYAQVQHIAALSTKSMDLTAKLAAKKGPEAQEEFDRAWVRKTTVAGDRYLHKESQDTHKLKYPSMFGNPKKTMHVVEIDPKILRAFEGRDQSYVLQGSESDNMHDYMLTAAFHADTPEELSSLVERYTRFYYTNRVMGQSDEQYSIGLISHTYKVIPDPSATYHTTVSGPEQIPMEGTPIGLTGFRYVDDIQEISLIDNGGECVVNALACRLKDHISKKTIASFFKKYKEAHNMTFRGITSEMVLAFCIEHKISCYGMTLHTMFLRYVPTHRAHVKVIAFICCDNHMYLVGEKTLQSLKAQNPVGKSLFLKASGAEEERVMEELETVDLDFIRHPEQPHEYTHVIQKYNGCRFCLDAFDSLPAKESKTVIARGMSNLNWFVRTFYEHYRSVPKVTMSSPQLVGKVNFTTKNGCKVTLLADKSPCNKFDYDLCKEVCRIFGVAFRNQTIGTMTMQIKQDFDLASQGKRKPLTKKQLAMLRETQESKCAVCGIKLANKKRMFAHDTTPTTAASPTDAPPADAAMAVVQEDESEENVGLDAGDIESECGEEHDVDHVEPRACGGSDALSNMALLCTTCHANKTKDEKETGYRYVSPEISSFNSDMYHLIQSTYGTKIPRNEIVSNVTASEWRKQTFCIDYVKMRRNLLQYSKYPFCVFSVLDNREQFVFVPTMCRKDGRYQLPNALYVIVFPRPDTMDVMGQSDEENEKANKKHIEDKDPSHLLQGNGLYCREIVEEALTDGLIDVHCIRYICRPHRVYEAANFIPLVKHYMSAYDHLEAYFNELYPELKKEEVHDMSEKVIKLLVNSLVGMFGIRDKKTYQSANTPTQDEVCLALLEATNPRVYNIGGDTPHLQMVVSETVRAVMETSYFPIFSQINDLEALYVYRLRKLIEERGGRVLYVKTDEVGYAAKEEIRLDGFFYNIKKDQVPKKGQVPAPMFAEKNDKVKYPLRYSTSCFVDECPPACSDWGTMPIPYDTAGEYDYATIVDECFFSEDKPPGLLLTGCPGTGKTYMTKQLIREVRRRYDDEDGSNHSVMVFCPTHCACLQVGFGAHTCAFMVNKFREQPSYFASARLIVVDEFSMARCEWVSILLQLLERYPHIAVLMIGDQYQLPAVADPENQSNDCTKLVNSHALKRLCAHRMLVLTEYKRGDGPGGVALFEQVCNIHTTGDITDPALFTPKEHTYLHLCHTNRKRQAVNQETNTRFIQTNNIPKTALVFIPENKKEKEWHLCVGTHVIACMTARTKDKELRKTQPTLFCNNERFVCVAISENKKEITLKRHESEETIVVLLADFKTQFRLGWCITIHASQGATFEEKYTIHQWAYLNKTLKYVALSRGRTTENVFVQNSR